uniref:Uncharacterized protein n=1 Tax=Arundo donax TaxID=35708 RepID=A0A0A9B6F8_ARUDO
MNSKSISTLKEAH